VSQANKDLLVISTFPRSGSTFLNFVIKSLYYKGDANMNYHTVNSLHVQEKVIVPFRNPEESIASWHIFPYKERSTLDLDIKYYLRFYTEVLNKNKNAVLLDFHKFTKDLDYVKNKISNNFGVKPIYETSIEEIKNEMLSSGKEINLPRNNANELQNIKNNLVNHKDFNNCLEIYNNLLKISEQQ
jgi:hypothetical protein